MKIMFVMVKEDYIDPMNIELLSAIAKQDGHDTFLNVLEDNNLLEEVPLNRAGCGRLQRQDRREQRHVPGESGHQGVI